MLPSYSVDWQCLGSRWWPILAIIGDQDHWLRHREIYVNTLRPRQNGRHFSDDTFERIFLNENARILFKISLKLVPKGPINNIPALVQIMAWRRPGDKPLSEPMITRLPTHICVTRHQWVKSDRHSENQRWSEYWQSSESELESTVSEEGCRNLQYFGSCGLALCNTTSME